MIRFRKKIAIEAIVSNAIGFLLTVGLQLVLFDESIWRNLLFSTALLGLHIVRSYFVRLWFKRYYRRKRQAAKALKAKEVTPAP